MSEHNTLKTTAAWRRGIMHVVERFDCLVPSGEQIPKSRALEKIEAIAALMDELTEFARSNNPASYADVFDLCSADLKAAYARRGVKLPPQPDEARDHGGGGSAEVFGGGHESVRPVAEIAKPAVAIGAQQAANSVELVTVIDMEVLPPASGPVDPTDGARAALLGEHLLVLRRGDASELSQVIRPGSTAGAEPQQGRPGKLGIISRPAVGGRCALLAAIPSGLLRTLFEGEALDGESLAALCASRCFHNAINEMICENDQVVTDMIPNSNTERRV